MPEMRFHRNQNRVRSSQLGRGQSADGKYLAADMNDDLSLLQIAMRVVTSCALTAVMAFGIFMVIRFVAWVG
jgi:hypothetical protein